MQKNHPGKLIIKDGHVIDPANSRDGLFDILVEDGIISALDAPGSFSSVVDAKTISAKGLIVSPGLIDIHVHLREPGFEWKETIITGTSAAVAGGFTTVCCMPNTKPVNDNASVTEFILKQAKAADKARVLPIGAITLGSEGKELAPMLELRDAGCVAFSDDGRPVSNAGIMRKALEYNLMLGTVLTVHEEVLSLSDGFSMHEGAMSLKLGLKGMPEAAENIMIARDIELSRMTGGRVHFCHVSTARGVTLIRRAKEDGIPVTAETAPHYFTLTDEAVEGYNTNAKMSMPLRRPEDVQALLIGLKDGVIDCIASDHAPHEADSKNCEFDRASFGILGLQTMLPLTLARVRDGNLSLVRAIELLTTSAAKCLGINGGTLSKGVPADVTLIDLNKKYLHTAGMICSKSKNTPFLNCELQGTAVKTFVAGKEVFSLEEFNEC